jgi:hypothetical protein
MRLSRSQCRFFYEQGYVFLPGMVSPALADHARRAINISVGRGMNVEDMPSLRVQSFCPELREDPALMGLLLESGIWGVAESLIGAGQIRPGSQGNAQINLRFPIEEAARLPLEPHLDGMASRANKVPKGQLRNFTALIGVMLADISTPDRGNFTVWPGSHLLNAAWLRENGIHSLLEGMPAVSLPEPVQITGRAGDLILCHYLLSHGTAANLSPDVRYMVFFRLAHVDHDAQRWESMADPWLQWPGIREAMHTQGP